MSVMRVQMVCNEKVQVGGYGGGERAHPASETPLGPLGGNREDSKISRYVLDVVDHTGVGQFEMVLHSGLRRRSDEDLPLPGA